MTMVLVLLLMIPRMNVGDLNQRRIVLVAASRRRRRERGLVGGVLVLGGFVLVGRLLQFFFVRSSSFLIRRRGLVSREIAQEHGEFFRCVGASHFRGRVDGRRWLRQRKIRCVVATQRSFREVQMSSESSLTVSLRSRPRNESAQQARFLGPDSLAAIRGRPRARRDVVQHGPDEVARCKQVATQFFVDSFILLFQHAEDRLGRCATCNLTRWILASRCVPYYPHAFADHLGFFQDVYRRAGNNLDASSAFISRHDALLPKHKQSQPKTNLVIERTTQDSTSSGKPTQLFNDVVMLNGTFSIHNHSNHSTHFLVPKSHTARRIFSTSTRAELGHTDIHAYLPYTDAEREGCVCASSVYSGLLRILLSAIIAQQLKMRGKGSPRSSRRSSVSFVGSSFPRRWKNEDRHQLSSSTPVGSISSLTG